MTYSQSDRFGVKRKCDTIDDSELDVQGELMDFISSKDSMDPLEYWGGGVTGVGLSALLEGTFFPLSPTA